MITIYHNGRCTKSRGALEILQEKGIPHVVRWYLAEPLTKVEIKTLLQKLGMKAAGLIRKNDALFKEHFAGKKMSEAACIKALTDYPELMERPIVENGDIAVIARPPERLNEIV